MSYIRGIENPEKLYIYGSRFGLEIWQPDKSTIHCNEEDFLTFVKKWRNNCDFFDNAFRYKNFSFSAENDTDGGFRVCIKIDDSEIKMYYATWMYIVEGVLYKLRLKSAAKRNDIISNIRKEAEIYNLNKVEEMDDESLIEFALTFVLSNLNDMPELKDSEV